MNALLLVFVAAVACVHCQSLDQLERIVFNDLDTDNDNKLVQAEFDAYLKKNDPDGDGSMTLAVFKSILQNTAPAEAAKQFNTYDINDDHVLDLKDSHQLFKAFDADDDGGVTMAEFKAKYVQLLVPKTGGVPVGK